MIDFCLWQEQKGIVELQVIENPLKPDGLKNLYTVLRERFPAEIELISKTGSFLPATRGGKNLYAYSSLQNLE